MEMKITFPENSVNGHKIDAHAAGHIIKTDQPKAYGADDSAPAPFLTFLAAIGTCSGWFLLRFLEARSLSLDGIELKMTASMDKNTHLIPEIKFILSLPDDFPAKYRKPLITAIHQCAVTRHMLNPPKFTTDIEVDGNVVISKSI